MNESQEADLFATGIVAGWLDRLHGGKLDIYHPGDNKLEIKPWPGAVIHLEITLANDSQQDNG